MKVDNQPKGMYRIIAEVVTNGKVDFAFAIIYLVIAVAFSVSYIMSALKNPMDAVLLPFIGMVEIITLVSIIEKTLSYRNALKALREFNTTSDDKLPNTVKYIKKSLKRTVESAIIDLTCTIIYAIYIVVSAIKYFDFKEIDNYVMLEVLIGIIMLAIAMTKSLLPFSTFKRHFGIQIEKKEDEKINLGE